VLNAVGFTPTNNFPQNLILASSCLATRVIFRKVASANEKGKENIKYFLTLSGKTAEFAITICC